MAQEVAWKASILRLAVRIARILTRLNLGGPARQALAADPLLLARGHEVRQFVGESEPGEGDLGSAMRAAGIEVVRIPRLARGISPWRDWRALAALRRELQDFRPDLVHTHASKAGALGRRAAGQLGLPAVHTFHGHVLEGYFSPRLSSLLIELERRAARRSARILAVSHATADDLLRLKVCREEQLVVVPPGIELEPLLSLGGRSGVLRAELKLRDEDLLVAVVGRLAPVKRPEMALEVFDLLAQRHPTLHLSFLGDGELREVLARAIQSSSIRSTRVHLLGARSIMAPLLADLDIVLSTSSSEGLPVALIEAAAAGLPVVATPVGGVGEIVAHERTGFLGQDATELGYGLAQLLESAELRHAMGQRARVRVWPRYSAAALTDRLEAVYRAVLEESPCAS